MPDSPNPDLRETYTTAVIGEDVFRVAVHSNRIILEDPPPPEPNPPAPNPNPDLQRQFMASILEYLNMGYGLSSARRYARNSYPDWSYPPGSIDYDAPFPEGDIVQTRCTVCRTRYVIAPPEFVSSPHPFRMRRDGTGPVSGICRECERRRAKTRASVRRNGRRFGVEIEVNTRLDRDDIAAALTRAGLDVYAGGYSHDVEEGVWKVVSDGSVCGWEVVSPPLRWAQRDQVRTVCRVLSDLECVAGHECGLHVHHEVGDLSVGTLKRLARFYHATQSHTDCLVASSRRATYGCQWCPGFSRSDLDRIERAESLGDLAQGDRYRALNLTPLTAYGTVEFRQHEGCTDPDKILAWVAYGQAMIQAAIARRAPHVKVPPDKYLDTLPFRDEGARDRLKGHAKGLPVPEPAYYESDDEGYNDGW